ncbi:MAG: hypothetical protein RL235_157 [Chlamydiota bacterium]|jgi:dUTP pyrophosphatase
MSEEILLPIQIEDASLLPRYATGGAAGADLLAHLSQPLMLLPGDKVLVPTGLRLEIPVGYEVQVRPRSGLAMKHGITVLNTPGTIDSDYRGEVMVLLINLGKESFTITHGMRIAQMVIAPVMRACFTAAQTLSATERQEGGFGHTGTH